MKQLLFLVFSTNLFSIFQQTGTHVTSHMTGWCMCKKKNVTTIFYSSVNDKKNKEGRVCSPAREEPHGLLLPAVKTSSAFHSYNYYHQSENLSASIMWLYTQTGSKCSPLVIKVMMVTLEKPRRRRITKQRCNTIPAQTPPQGALSHRESGNATQSRAIPLLQRCFREINV